MPPHFLSHLHRLTVFLHLALLLALFGLVAGGGLGARLLLGAAACLPLLLPLPGLLRQRGYTASWASLVVVFYAALLLAEAYMQPHERTVLLELAVLAALDFVALMLYAKARKRAERSSI
jgi:uncharacterized membrane protein